MTNIIKELYLKSINEINEKASFITKYVNLNEYLSKLRAGDIITIGGRPAMGKIEFSMLLVNEWLSQNIPISFFSMITQQSEVVSRLISEKLTLEEHYIYNIDQEKILSEIDWYNNKNLNIIYDTKLSILKIEEHLKNKKPSIIFIDNYQSISKLEKSTILLELKRIAIENNLLIVILSEISRKVERREDKRPLLLDLKGDSILEEMSDLVLMIYREQYYDYLSSNTHAEVIVRKCKNSCNSIINLDFSKGHFRELLCDKF